MSERIDTLLNRLKAAPMDRDLSRLESDVWSRIDGPARTDFFGRHAFQVQLAVSCGALLLGLAIAQFTGYSPMPRLNSEMIVLSDDSAMAPSVRLEGGI
jgi:hypothetical protein